MDFLKLDKSKGGYEYVLVVTDHFTRYVQAYPTKNKSAKSAADKLYNNYILTYGFPRQIHHDRVKNLIICSSADCISYVELSQPKQHHIIRWWTGRLNE